MQLAKVDSPHLHMCISHEDAGVAGGIDFHLIVIDDRQIKETKMRDFLQKLLVHLTVYQAADDALPGLFEIRKEGDVAGWDGLILGVEAEYFLSETGKTGAFKIFLIIGIQVDGGSGVFSREQDRHAVHHRQVYFLNRTDADPGLRVCALPDFFRNRF